MALAFGRRTRQIGTMILRDETPSDHAAVRALLAAAFPTLAEADLVERLRAAGDAAFEAVAVGPGGIVGHAMLSRMAAPFPALGLAPVAVAAEARRRGVGAALIARLLAGAEAAGWRAAFVVGDPAYYGRFGFDADLAAPFASPYAGPYLMACALGGPLPAGSGRVDYAPAFAALS